MPLRALNLPTDFIYVFAFFVGVLPLLKFRRYKFIGRFVFLFLS